MVLCLFALMGMALVLLNGNGPILGERVQDVGVQKEFRFGSAHVSVTARGGHIK